MLGKQGRADFWARNIVNYQLFGCRDSGSMIIELALAKIGAVYDLVEVDLHRHAQRDESYARVNPQRKIPALVTDSGELLTESAAILITLDERHPEAQLLPPVASVERAQALRTLLFVATELYPIVEINDYPERFAPRVDGAPEVRDLARDIWRQRWKIVEGSIVGDPFLLPWGYSAVDMYIAVVSRWAQQDDWRAAGIPLVE